MSSERRHKDEQIQLQLYSVCSKMVQSKIRAEFWLKPRGIERDARKPAEDNSMLYCIKLIVTAYYLRFRVNV